MTVSEARAALPRVLDRVGAGEEVTITRHGKPVAVIVRPESLRARRAEEALAVATSVGGILEKGRTERLRARPRLTQERAAELAAEVRAGRSSR
jgi:prevent-host-death family protein